jgi:hypothetical protein
MQKLFVVMIFTLIIGCFGGVDVTNDPNFNYGYRKGQIYESSIDLYIFYGWDNYLKLPGKHSPKLEEYLQNPTSYNDIKGVLKKKSMLRIEKLSYRETFESSYLDIFARILNSEYKDELVELSLVSKIELEIAPKGGFMRKPDPQILKLVEMQ